MQTRYLLWDHDGVLVDTERWYFEATRVTLAPLGIELSEDSYLTSMTKGQSSWDLARERGFSEDEIQEHRKTRNVQYQEYLRTKPIEIAHVDEVLTHLASRYCMAIITTAKRSDFELIHRDRDLLRHFEFVLTVEDYPRTKPHPDPYQAGLTKFGACPEEAVALEDSARGLSSAIAANIRCLVIQNDFTASQNFTGAWRIVESIRDVPQALSGKEGPS